MKIARKRPREKFRQIHLQMKARIRNHGDGEGSNIIWGVTKLSSMQRLLFFRSFLNSFFDLGMYLVQARSVCNVAQSPLE